MKKLLITAALMSVFTLANANITNASINGERVRVGDTYGQIVGKLGQPASSYDYTKNIKPTALFTRIYIVPVFRFWLGKKCVIHFNDSIQ